ncbi:MULTISPECIES: hypothetical protein [Pseudomonas]|uniref:Uncharacterized protein n=1 Tax=Pseudomonas fluorescens TaxID=294 RepID=A0A166QME2_PSEFL|nr:MULTISPECIES: hypothetical protein [Pseudomonas]KZN20521.1 hypothetical protein A1D17_02980 [Pseudomonas fluorescens]
MALSNAQLIRKHVAKLERDKAKLLAALRELANFSGGSDHPETHPLGAAHALLREFDAAETKKEC